jgi:hypothetical protein
MIKIPKVVAGRTVTKRGVHLHPSGHHGYWCRDAERRADVLELLLSMHMSWVVMLTDGGSILDKYDGYTPAEWMLMNGIIPIVRDYCKLPAPFSNMATVEALATVYDRYGVPLLFKCWNEPQDDREWASGTAPDDWWERFIDRWNAAAPLVLQNGGYPGFPDGPGYDFDKQHPFRDTARYLWDDNLAWYALHNYAKGRPIDYPYDQVSQHGTELHQWEKDEMLDDFKDDPVWTDPPLEDMNRLRKKLAVQGKTVLDDDTCWMAGAKVLHYAREHLGHSVKIATVEGGWVPRDRAGTGLDIDYRWPHTTPKMVAKKTIEAMAHYSEYLFAVCPWLLADSEMGHGGWPYDAWWGWAYLEQYGMHKPVIHALQEYSPGLPPTTPGVDWPKILNIAEDIEACLSTFTNA